MTRLRPNGRRPGLSPRRHRRNIGCVAFRKVGAAIPLVVALASLSFGGGVPVAATPAGASAGEHRAAEARRDCTEDGWCWDNPLPNGNASLALWGSGADDVWAAGDGGTILHWNGATWSRVKGLPNVDLRAIWGRGPNDVWTAGDKGTVLHWDGKTWSNRSIPVNPGGWRLIEISGGDGAQIWVADSLGRVSSWNGSAWESRVPAPPVRPNSTWAWDTLKSSGGGTIVHPPPWLGYWDGTALVRARTPPPPGDRLYGGTRASSVWLRTWLGGAEVSRWMGKRWEPLGSGVGASWTPAGVYPSTHIAAIWGASDDDVWAVGASGQILRWNGGSRWKSFDGGTRGNLNHVWGSGPNDVWASGEAGMLHWDGARWKTVTTSASDVQLNDVWGTDSCHAWAVGNEGTILRRDCDGWSPVASSVTVDLSGVGGSTPDDVWAVGRAGTILHLDDKGRWVKASSPTSLDLFAVWASSPTEAWAVGFSGILHWDGVAWKEAPTPAHRTLRSIHGIDPKQVIAVGEDGRILSWDGARWSVTERLERCPEQYRGDRGSSAHAWMRAAAEVWVACPTARVFRGDGAKWKESGDAEKKTYAYYDVAASADGIWVVGAKGTILQLSGGSGAAWTAVASGTGAVLRAIWATPSGDAWIVGDHGTILSRK